jgi:hypothetical protein
LLEAADAIQGLCKSGYHTQTLADLTGVVIPRGHPSLAPSYMVHFCRMNLNYPF